MSYGCPYWKYNFAKDREDCKITGGEVLCDGDYCTFTFEDCPNYKKTLEPLSDKPAEQITIDEVR